MLMKQITKQDYLVCTYGWQDDNILIQVKGSRTATTCQRAQFLCPKGGRCTQVWLYTICVCL